MGLAWQCDRCGDTLDCEVRHQDFQRTKEIKARLVAAEAGWTVDPNNRDLCRACTADVAYQLEREAAK